MSLNSYRFRGMWHVAAPQAAVYDVLSDIGNYPTWWREVRSAVRVDDECAELTCRSLLPFTLVIRARHSIQDQRAGLLRATLEGDLEGFASWEISGRAGGTDLVFDQEVVVNKTALRRLVLVTKPFLRGNHDAMMRSGLKGLRRHLTVRAATLPDA